MRHIDKISHWVLLTKDMTSYNLVYARTLPSVNMDTGWKLSVLDGHYLKPFGEHVGIWSEVRWVRTPKFSHQHPCPRDKHLNNSVVYMAFSKLEMSEFLQTIWFGCFISLSLYWFHACFIALNIWHNSISYQGNFFSGYRNKCKCKV